MDQRMLMAEFNERENAQRFNEKLFYFDEQQIINDLKSIILSCQRSGSFTIRVNSFDVIENYSEIVEELRAYEQSKIKEGSHKVNIYDFINLKDSSVILLVVNYFISIAGESDNVRVLIAVPRVVDKYYFKIQGNLYSAMWQIVDASTYNNSTSRSKVQTVTLKTMFMAVRVYRTTETLKLTNKENIPAAYYRLSCFKKSVPIFKYFFAYFGYYRTLDFFGMASDIFLITDYDIESPDYYTTMKNNIYISVSKFMYNREPLVQNIAYTLHKAIDKNTTINTIFDRDYWIASLGSEFSNNSYEKGLNIMESLLYIYDSLTKQSIHLPEEKKSDVYHVLKWILVEFDNLREKDNFNIIIKRMRKSGYLVSIYATKLATGIYRISDNGKKARLNTIKKAIMTKPMYLVNEIVRCSLVPYNSMINDMDSFNPIGFTFKGISGIGENKSKSIPKAYMTIYPEYLNVLDLDTSSAGDPGVSGMLCPLAKVYGENFSEFEEPNTWDDRFNKVLDEYNAVRGTQQCIEVREKFLGQILPPSTKQLYNDIAETMDELIRPIEFVDRNTIIEASEAIVNEDLVVPEQAFTPNIINLDDF